MSRYKAENPSCNFVFACGSDLFHYMGKWLYGKELLSEVEFIIFKRKGDKELLEELLPKRYSFVETEEVSEMSSTIVRNILKWVNSVESRFLCLKYL